MKPTKALAEWLSKTHSPNVLEGVDAQALCIQSAPARARDASTPPASVVVDPTLVSCERCRAILRERPQLWNVLATRAAHARANAKAAAAEREAKRAADAAYQAELEAAQKACVAEARRALGIPTKGGA